MCGLWNLKSHVCVFFTVHRSIYSSAPSTTNVCANSSIPQRWNSRHMLLWICIVSRSRQSGQCKCHDIVPICVLKFSLRFFLFVRFFCFGSCVPFIFSFAKNAYYVVPVVSGRITWHCLVCPACCKSMWRSFVATGRWAFISLLMLSKNRHRHWLCMISTGRKIGWTWTTHTRIWQALHTPFIKEGQRRN